MRLRTPRSFLEMPKVGNNDVQAWVLDTWTEPPGLSRRVQAAVKASTALALLAPTPYLNYVAVYVTQGGCGPCISMQPTSHSIPP